MEAKLKDLENRLQAHEEAHQRALADVRRSLDNLTEFVEANQAAILDLMGKLQDLQAQILGAATAAGPVESLEERMTALENVDISDLADTAQLEDLEARLGALEDLGLLAFTETTADRLDNVEEGLSSETALRRELSGRVGDGARKADSLDSQVMDLERRVGNVEDDIRRLDR